MKPQEIAEKIFANAPETVLKKKKARKAYEHTGRVVALCKMFADELQRVGISVNLNILLMAAWLHDVGKSVNKDAHAEAKTVQLALEPYKDDLKSEMDALLSIIPTHNSEDFSPDDKYKLESAILRICDKLDKYTQAALKQAKGKSHKAKGDEKMAKCNVKKAEGKEQKAAKKFAEAKEEYAEAADKFTKATKKFEEAEKKCPESMEKIQNALDFGVWSKFQEVYNPILKRVRADAICAGVRT